MPSKHLQAKFAEANRSISDALVERHGEVSLVLTALLAKEHALLVGMPGTAKSMLLDAVAKWLDATLFKYLMTKFTEPSELFGPTDLVAMTQERKFRRVLDGTVVEANLVFIDEVFRGSSAILNSLLGLMNEREYKNGSDGWNKTPVRSIFGASNDWPDEQNGGQDLSAFFDRFLFRKHVRPVRSPSGLKRLLWERTRDLVPAEKLTLAELDQATYEVTEIPITGDTKVKYEECIRELRKAGIEPGDRRIVKSVQAVQAYAYLAGADRAEPEHLEILSHILWAAPEQAEKAGQIIAKIACPTGTRLSELMAAAEDAAETAMEADAAGRIPLLKKLETIVKDLAALETDSVVGKKARKFRADVQRKIYEVQMLALHGPSGVIE